MDNYTRRGFFAFGPLCGTGVASLMPVISMPCDMNPRIAGSRPEPTPLTTTSASFTPRLAAFSPTVSPTFDAANGVPFFAPLKPRLPDELQKSVAPFLSEKTTLVLLKVAWMCRVPATIFFFGVRRVAAGAAAFGAPSSVVVVFLVAMVIVESGSVDLMSFRAYAYRFPSSFGRYRERYGSWS
jgi:hypothetical protein